MDDPDHATEFEWDEGNAQKNWARHRVSQAESEQIFFNQPQVITLDELHAQDEVRYLALGRTDANRLLFVVYTVRGEKLRISSVRDMTRRERKEYERAEAQELETDSPV
ncbi:MAG: BrnT family toxin [Acidobacteria bacterium]|nr:BrnT family toxin [Acidobacteriota bacterium]